MGSDMDSTENPDIDYLERVRALAPTILGAADQAERDHALPAELVAALHAAGLFRLLLPVPYGGGEVDLPTFFQVIEAVARHDASTAWCLCQSNGCAMTAAYMDALVARDIWGDDPAASVAWGPGKATVTEVEGGYRVTGNWMFASGGRHATWFGGHTNILDTDENPTRNADGTPAVRTMMMPAANVPMKAIWEVVGLLGTGSDAFAVEDLFVAKEYTVLRDILTERRYHAPLYHFPAMSLYAAGFAGTALGIARSMYESFMEIALEKTPRLQRSRLAEDAVVQWQVAQAKAKLESARAYLLDELSQVWDGVVASGTLTVEQRMRIRLCSTYAIHQAKEAADTVYEMAGATAIFNANPFERRFRDLHTVTQQLQGRKSHFQTVGAFLFGNTPNFSVS
jgi:alkylation response protein AidB-like acyl-CoA dehydrogenase